MPTTTNRPLAVDHGATFVVALGVDQFYFRPVTEVRIEVVGGTDAEQDAVVGLSSELRSFLDGDLGLESREHVERAATLFVDQWLLHRGVRRHSIDAHALVVE